MVKPDGSHDKLGSHEAYAVEQNLRHTGLWTEPEVRREAGLLRLLFAGVTAAALVVALSLLVLWVDERHARNVREGRPIPTFVVPATPAVTPFPSGWEPS